MGRPFSFKEIFATTFKNGQLPTLGHIEKLGNKFCAISLRLNLDKDGNICLY
jgi:hypothetical protein